MDAFKSPFSFEEFFKALVKDVLPVLGDGMVDANQADSEDGSSIIDRRYGAAPVCPPFREAEKLLPLLKRTRTNLVDLCYQVDARSERLRNDVGSYSMDHEQIFGELEKGIESLGASFNRLDHRITEVSQTAAKIGDHLESADSHRITASQTIDLIRHMMHFNENTRSLLQESSLFSDEERVAEATAVAQKLREIAEVNMAGVECGPVKAEAKDTANASKGLDVAVKHLQVYCNEVENRLLAKFDTASHKGDLSIMAECAKILSKFNQGASAIQRYVTSRPMFMNLEVMNKDLRTVLGPEGGHLDVSDIMKGLSSVYKDILETVQKEAKIVVAVFPSPAAVMAVFIQAIAKGISKLLQFCQEEQPRMVKQSLTPSERTSSRSSSSRHGTTHPQSTETHSWTRVLEQRVASLLDKLLPRPSLTSPAPMEQGGLQNYLRTLAGAYAKTKELANDLQSLGIGDLNIEALADSLFSSYTEDYSELELTSLNQLYKAKVMELKLAPRADPSVPSKTQRRNSAMHWYAPISVNVVEELICWNEESVTRCKLLTFKVQPGLLATIVRSIFTCLLDQVSQYVTEGLERAMEPLNAATALRERFGTTSTNNRKVAAVVAAAAEAATTAGESSFRAFMVVVQNATTIVTKVQQYFSRNLATLLIPLEGAYAACCEEMGTAMADAEQATLTGLRICINALLGEVERLLVAEQMVTDYKPPEDGTVPHDPTRACKSVTSYLARMLVVAEQALEGLNKEAFMTELANRLYKLLLLHWRRFTFSASGGLRLKRDVSEFADFIRTFKSPAVDAKFEFLSILVNVFIVAPESLSNLVDGTLSNARQEAIRLIQLREDYKKAKISAMFTAVKE